MSPKVSRSSLYDLEVVSAQGQDGEGRTMRRESEGERREDKWVGLVTCWRVGERRRRRDMADGEGRAATCSDITHLLGPPGPDRPISDSDRDRILSPMHSIHVITCLVLVLMSSLASQLVLHPYASQSVKYAATNVGRDKVSLFTAAQAN